MGRDERVEHDGYESQLTPDVARQLDDAASLFAHVLSLIEGDTWERTMIYSYPERMERSLRWVAVHTLHEARHHKRVRRSSLSASQVGQLRVPGFRALEQERVDVSVALEEVGRVEADARVELRPAESASSRPLAAGPAVAAALRAHGTRPSHLVGEGVGEPLHAVRSGDDVAVHVEMGVELREGQLAVALEEREAGRAEAPA